VQNSHDLHAQIILDELIRRKRAQVSLLDYTSFIQDQHKPALHHRVLIEHLEAVARGDIPRLMVNMPPGSAKSFYCSRIFPAWYMGRYPGSKVMCASNSMPLALDASQDVRGFISQPEYQQLFGSQGQLRSGQAGVTHWVCNNKSGYKAAGVGVRIAGFRVKMGIIDDPVGSAADADSEAKRNAAWAWYKRDFLTRLVPGAAQVVIMTRWHEDDLGGRILERDGAKWTVLKLPMEAGADDPLGRALGDRLWPEYYTHEMVDDAKKDPRGWSALYQQTPAPDDGIVFKPDDFVEYRTAPADMQIIMSIDPAVTKDGGDFTEIGVAGRTDDNCIYLIDWWRGQVGTEEWAAKIVEMAKMYRPFACYTEKGPIWQAAKGVVARTMDENGYQVRMEPLPVSIGNKVMRAGSIATTARQKRLLWPQGAGWVPELQHQCLSFPGGKRDDGVDALGLIGRGFDEIGQKPGCIWDKLAKRESLGNVL
jgi:predicted phage terminase large subunit-like protein